jgi:leucyl aminopeptidase
MRQNAATLQTGLPMSLELLAANQNPPADAVPIHVVDRQAWPHCRDRLDEGVRRWLGAVGFDAAPDSHALVAAPDGSLQAVWAGVRSAQDPYALAALPRRLPAGRYRLGDGGLELSGEAAALSWELGSYVFDLYKPAAREPATLLLAGTEPSSRGALVAAAVAAVRDLVNTPCEHMGPAELAEAARMVAREHGARFRQVRGEALLKKGFPAIHAVGRAAAREPRLIELNWGDDRHPRVAIVGKGVCFDTGGLDIKTADGMRLMKKDMGGAANALGLASLVMALRLPVRLQVLVPAVENAIAGNAYRPGDVIRTRAGVHVEIGNTDAEGRVILCDALALAVESKPDLLIDLATLTGAARVALGPHLPALFCRRTELARRIVDRGLEIGDPLWHMPLWQPYHANIESDIADIVNTGKGGMAGAVTAALFLADFVPEGIDWLHVDLFAWNDAARPGRPVGGEAQTIRTLLAMLQERYAG